MNNNNNKVLDFQVSIEGYPAERVLRALKGEKLKTKKEQSTKNNEEQQKPKNKEKK
ncbi:hypothetical protein [Helicobacter sp.]|uniref:hypothetical protein n=1 Tax=Helicobacter sp. TaxID=218 RepID=UPI0025C16B49|nr:hypothetical protein [Helicobacter sp.]MCI5969073.1 hypothetical protein [Helicobacter sp.]